MHSLSVIACDSVDGICSSHDCSFSILPTKPINDVNPHCILVSLKTQYGLTSRRTRDKLLNICCMDLYLSTASGYSTPPTTPTQAASQPVFTQEAQQSGPSPERLEPNSRSRCLSTPPDTGQRLGLPSAKPPIPSSSPVPPYSTSQHVSHTAKMLLILKPLKRNAIHFKNTSHLICLT